MIHFHGTPMTPASDAARVLRGRHALISYAHPEQMELVSEVCQSFCLDNGAFTAWKSGRRCTDWAGYYAWVERWRTHPGFEFAIIPDVIDGDEDDNDALLVECPFDTDMVPVWHMHESLDRLDGMARSWPRIAIGSSGIYRQVKSELWWRRIAETMDVLCIGGRPRTKLHGLRMLDPDVFTRLPLASADSTNVARNMGLDQKWRGSYAPTTAAGRGAALCDRIESLQSAPIWRITEPESLPLFA